MFSSKISFCFIASECKWHCSYLNKAIHVTFTVKIYSHQERENHVVEMQRLEGDYLFFRTFYETVSQRLRNERIEDTTDWENLSDLPAHATTDETIVKYTQHACVIYSDETPADPKEVDIDRMKELIKIVNESETKSDWACQHAVWALSSMSLNKKYCLQMSRIGQLGVDFLQSVIALAVRGTFNTRDMRFKCVELINNLIGADPDYVFSVLDETEIDEWQNERWVQKVMHSGSTGKNIGQRPSTSFSKFSIF